MCSGDGGRSDFRDRDGVSENPSDLERLLLFCAAFQHGPQRIFLALLDAAISNVIIGNCGAHSKNFSLPYLGAKARLAPLGDLTNTVAYPEVSSRMAMKLGGASRIDDVTGDTWATFATDVGLGAPFVRGRVRELAQ